MRKLATLLISALALTVVLTTTPAHAAPPEPDAATTTFIVRHGHSSRGAAAGLGLAATEGTTCDWVTVTMTRDTVYSLVGRLDWCHNGVSVGGHGTWSYQAYGVYYFDRWTNPPNDYYDAPSYTTIHTVAQAKFCASWCASRYYVGANIWGNADGTYGVQRL